MIIKPSPIEAQNALCDAGAHVHLVLQKLLNLSAQVLLLLEQTRDTSNTKTF